MGLAAAIGLGPLSLSAQDKVDRSTSWRLEGLRSGFCVQLLLDPATASRELPGGLRPLRADQVPDLHPAVRTVVREQPEFASWTPSRFCLFYFSSVEMPTGRAQPKDARKSPLIGLWSAAAVDASNGSRRDGALQLFSGNSTVSGAGTRAGLQFREVQSVIGKVPFEDENGIPSEDDRFRVKLGKTLVTWDGRPTGDSTRPDGVLTERWATEGRHGGIRDTRLTLRPEWTRGMAGAFRIEGRDAVAKALRESPIRFVGPLYIGGGGELSFDR